MTVCSADRGSEGRSQGKEPCLFSQVSREVEAADGQTDGQAGAESKEGKQSLTKRKRAETPDKHSSCGLISASQAGVMKTDGSFSV